MGYARKMKIGFLHLAPDPEKRAENWRRLFAGVSQAAAMGARWVLTPELCTSGYTFATREGVEWMEALPDAGLRTIALIANASDITVFVGTTEKDDKTELLFNSLAILDGKNGLIGSYRKVNVSNIGSEAWSTTGASRSVMAIQDFGLVGLMICADACQLSLAENIKESGARAIISSVNWSPGEWGPNGEWESISEMTGVPVFVCNRTGKDGNISFENGATCVVYRGRRLLSFQSTTPSLVLVDWDFENDCLEGWSHQILDQSYSTSEYDAVSASIGRTRTDH